MPKRRLAYPENPAQNRVLPIDRPQCSCTTMRRAARALTRLYDDALAPAGLRLTQFSLLANLDRYGAVSMIGLTGILDVDRTTLTRNLAPLEREGFLALESSGRGREKLVTLTQLGRERLAQAYPFWTTAQTQFGTIVGAARTREFELLARELAALMPDERGLS